MQVTITHIGPAIEVTSPVIVAGVGYVSMTAEIAAALFAADVRTDSSGLNKGLADTYAVSDAAKVTTIKKLSDALVNTDKVTLKAFGKKLNDPVASTDALARIVEFYRTYTDTASAADAAAISFIKALTDSVTTADADAISVSKSLTETVTTTDADVIAVTKLLTEAMTAADAAAKSFAKSLNDSATNSDAGSVLTQNYVNSGDYFASDYVGSSRTF